MVSTQDHFIESALLPQAEDTVAVEELALLTPLEEITTDTDFRQYLQDGVPADVRREALRKALMWRCCQALRGSGEKLAEVAA